MKNENIPADIKSKSLKEAREEIDRILTKLESQESDLSSSLSDYERLIKLNKYIDYLFKKKFKEKSHYELGEKLGMLDFDLATKTTGSRFVFLKDKLSLLERALSNFMLDVHTLHNGYEEISPPLIASENTMYGTGQLPKFENDQFEIKFDKNDERKWCGRT